MQLKSIVLTWFILSLGLNVLGVFTVDPNTLPLAFLLSVIGPPVLFALAYASSEKVQRLSMQLDLQLITAIQAWRLVGIMFLVLFHFGLLPGTFAWPAGVGDIIGGLRAIRSHRDRTKNPELVSTRDRT